MRWHTSSIESSSWCTRDGLQGLGGEAEITSEGIHEEFHEDPVRAEFQARAARDTEMNMPSWVSLTRQPNNSQISRKLSLWLPLCSGASIDASAFGFLMRSGFPIDQSRLGSNFWFKLARDLAMSELEESVRVLRSKC